MATGINYRALDAIRARQERAFYKLNDLSDNYISGEEWWREGFSLHPLEVMVIGEAPGAQENIAKRPFVGQAGVILRRLMTEAELPHAWITNAIKFRPARNRTPLTSEMELAKPYLIREWVAIGCPRIILLLGNVALETVTGRAGVTKRCGAMEMWQATDGNPCYVWPMLHPSFGVRNPAMRKPIENDWDHLREWLRVHKRG